MTATAQDLRASAAAHEAKAEESFQRCDTDGFLSQWADGICGRRDRLQAEILEAGGLWQFPALFDLSGNWVPARLIETRFGDRWMVLDAAGRSTGQFLPWLPARRATQAKHGFVQGRVLRPAVAFIDGKGTGMSGSAWAAVRATDKPWEAPAAIVVCDAYAEKESK